MNKICLIFLPVIFMLSSCKHETTVMEERYPDGSPKKECVSGKIDSKRQLLRETTWYAKKKIQMMGTYKNEVRDGKGLYYYEHGNVWSEGFFKDGKSDGKRTTHYK